MHLISLSLVEEHNVGNFSSSKFLRADTGRHHSRCAILAEPVLEHTVVYSGVYLGLMNADIGISVLTQIFLDLGKAESGSDG